MCSINLSAQKQNDNVLATATVKKFYRFHTTHDDLFNAKQVALRSKFFTPKLQKLFNRELIRQKNYLKKYPDNKPYFEGLPFQPIEFCRNDYRIEKAIVNNSTASVKVDFVYGKSDCKSNDGTAIFYKFTLLKIGGKWLIDTVLFDDGSDLLTAFETAQKIK